MGQHYTLIKGTLTTPSWDHDDMLPIDLGSVSWMTLIINYLTNDAFPDDSTSAKKVR